MSGEVSDRARDLSTNTTTSLASNAKAVVVGLYRVPGSGKTFLLNKLRRELEQEHFAFYEGSKVIATVVPGGLKAFHSLDEAKKLHWRQRAIDMIKKVCIASGKTAVITGHFMF